MKPKRWSLTGIILLSMMVLVTLPGLISASVPGQMSYQGLLLDVDGLPLTGDYNMTFSIYADSTGGIPLWVEDHNNTTRRVTVTGGLFEVILGEFVLIDPSVFDGSVRWLQTAVSGEALLPRKPITSSAYAFRSAGGNGIDSVLAGDGLAGSDEGGPVVALDIGAGTGISVGEDAISLDVLYTDSRYVNEGEPTGYQLMDFVTYVGNGDDNRNIAHDLGRTPSLIFIINISGGAPGNSQIWCSAKGGDNTMEFAGDSWGANKVQGADDNSFQVGSDGRVNGDGRVYLAVLYGDA